MIERRVAGRSALGGHVGGDGEGRGQSRLALLEGGPLLIEGVEAAAGACCLVGEACPVSFEFEESRLRGGNLDLLDEQGGGGDERCNQGMAQG